MDVYNMVAIQQKSVTFVAYDDVTPSNDLKYTIRCNFE